MDTNALWQFLVPGYFRTIAVEIPVLMIGLSTRHHFKERLIAGFGLTAFTYPIVVLVLPPMLVASFGYAMYLVVAETFAPLAECVLFTYLFHANMRTEFRERMRDWCAITVANLSSFLLGFALSN